MICALHTLQTEIRTAEEFTLRCLNIAKCCNIICISGNTEPSRETLRIFPYNCNFKIPFTCPLHLVEWVIFLICIRKISSSNPSPRTGCPDSFSYFFSASSGKFWDNGSKQTRPFPFTSFRSIIQEPLCHLALIRRSCSQRL